MARSDNQPSCALACATAGFSAYTGIQNGPACCAGNGAPCVKCNRSDTIGLSWGPPVALADIPKRNGKPKADPFNHPFFRGYQQAYYPGRTCAIHRGVDVYAADGTKVIASADGEVAKTSSHVVYIKHTGQGKTITSQYGHTSAHLVKAGDRVTRGRAISHVQAGFGHVHVEMYRGENTIMASSSKIVKNALGVLVTPSLDEFPHHRVLREADLDLLDPFDILGKPEQWTDTPAAPSCALCFPLGMTLPEGISQDDAFEIYYRVNECGGAFGYFPLGRDLLWHGGVHLQARQGDHVYNVYKGRIIAAKLDRGSSAPASSGFILVEHELEAAAGPAPAGGAAQTPRRFYSLHVHCAGEDIHVNSVVSSPLAWIDRLVKAFGVKKNSWRPMLELLPHGLPVYDDSENAAHPAPAHNGEPAGLMKDSLKKQVCRRKEFDELARWEDGKGGVYVRFHYDWNRTVHTWACVQNKKQVCAERKTTTVIPETGGRVPQAVRDLLDGKPASFIGDRNFDSTLRVDAGEEIGRCGRLPSSGAEKLAGIHFEIFAGSNLALSDTVTDFSLLPGPDSAPVLRMAKAYGSYADDAGKPSLILDKSVKPALATDLPAYGFYREGNNRWALTDVSAAKRWVLYEWPSSKGVVKDGILTKALTIPWYVVTDSGAGAVYGRETAAPMIDLMNRADPAHTIPDGIMKRDELAAFYRYNEGSFRLRHTCLDGLSEWSVDPETLFGDSRTDYLPKGSIDKLKAEIEPFRFWKNLDDVISRDGFAAGRDGDKVRHYRYHPLTFLRWLALKTGAECIHRGS